MLLKKIKYHNFRPFIGDQEIVLTPDNESGKNVIVVLGNNTFGKSTFVLSFIWCLYGESRFSRKDDILKLK
jgi:DNA sulfur modification protein DndD